MKILTAWRNYCEAQYNLTGHEHWRRALAVALAEQIVILAGDNNGR
jgi:hypothetical protein